MVRPPPMGRRRYVKIFSKKANMFRSSSGSPLSRKTSRSTTPVPSEELTELSDVPCYTCRRRHVKCDGLLPTCAKCAKRGVPCLGYQKPLRWAEGVAVRGKLKGKSQPVVDKKVASIVEKTMQLQSSSALQEAAHFGLQASGSAYTDVVESEATLLELMAYHNSRICAETVTLEQSRFTSREIAPLSIELIQKLPRVVVNCILGNAAVHMASRQPGDRAKERLALETKVKVFQSFNQALKSPQSQQPDVIVMASNLVFAMDLFEYGMSRWQVHFLGAVQVTSSFGGLENLFVYYPHLQVTLTHMAYLETLWVILSPIPATKTKMASRRAVEMLCHASLIKRRFFTPCPAPLLLSVWDIGACASKLLGPRTADHPAELRRRERILLEVLAFSPEDHSNTLKDTYYNASLPVTRPRNWDLIGTAWKAATTILTLRYLYLGRPNLAPQGELPRSATPSLATPTSAWHGSQAESSNYFQGAENIDLGAFLDEIADPEQLPEYLSAGLALNDPLSRSPSPMPSPLPTSDPLAASLWPNRYSFHNDAFSTLSSSFFELHDALDPICFRHILLPLLILGLVSRKDSAERRLCLSYFAKWKDFMSRNYPPDTAQAHTQASTSSSPVGGAPLEFDIPWDRLDAFSEMMEQNRPDSVHVEGGHSNSAPEWNWWDMLNHLKMDLLWPITSGTSHMERGSEFWPFNLISSVVNEDTFSVWTRPPQASPSSSA